jgi:hypothetical protein
MSDDLRKMKHEALLAIKDSPGLAVIVEKLGLMMKAPERGIKLGETNWAIKAGHAQGYVEGLSELSQWLNGSLSYYIDSNGELARDEKPPHLADRA